jgi:hypothetical protein
MSEHEREERTDAEELREVLGVVSEKIPGLLKGLRDVLYSKEAAENMADAVGTFYKKLVEAGIPKEEALDMARGYMINLRDVLKSAKFAEATHKHVHEEDDDEEEEDD